MVKSTPIAQIIQPPQQQAITHPPPQQQYQEDTNEDINIEDLVQEKERLSTIQHKQQSELQNQIDSLKREIEMNKSNISSSPQSTPLPVQQLNSSTPQTQQSTPQSIPQSMTDSFINKNAILSIVGDLDYFLFVIVVFIAVVVYSESVRSFIFQKLELKNLSYLTSYTQAFLSALLVVLIKKLN